MNETPRIVGTTRRIHLLVILSGVVAALLCWSCSSQKPTQGEDNEHAELQWVGTEVLYDATVEKKDLSLLFILVDWCGACQHLKSETLTDPDVVQRISESFNAAQINGESSAGTPYMDTTVSCRYLADTVYNVQYYPTMLVLNRAGELLETDIGYQDPGSFLEMLDRILKTY